MAFSLQKWHFLKTGRTTPLDQVRDATRCDATRRDRDATATRRPSTPITGPLCDRLSHFHFSCSRGRIHPHSNLHHVRYRYTTQFRNRKASKGETLQNKGALRKRRISDYSHQMTKNCDPHAESAAALIRSPLQCRNSSSSKLRVARSVALFWTLATTPGRHFCAKPLIFSPQESEGPLV